DNSTPAESISSEWTFTVSNYKTVPPIFATGAGQVNKSQPGFRARVHQMTVGRGPGDPNWVQNGERQLADGFIDSATGLPYPNVAQPGTDPDGWFTIPDIINWSGDAGVERGFYTSANNFPDAPVPGIPGTTDSTDWFAAEIITYLELKTGTYRFVVNSDDGFKLSTGPDAREALGVILGQFNGGRGASDTIFDVYVEADGIYPFRLAWWEGGGESNVEFAVIDLATGTRTLINDLSAAGAIKAYAQRSGAPPYVAAVSPEVNAVIVPPDAPITARIVDGETVQVDPDSVVVSLDGIVQERAVSKTGNSTSVRVVPANIYASGSTHRVTLSYSELGAPLNVHTGSWDFTVLGYVVLPPELASPIGSGNANERGFKIRIHQTDSGASAGGPLYNRNSRAEAQLRGQIPTGDGSLLPNVASGEFFTDADVINWNQDAPGAVGNFSVDNGKEDELIPGIPGTTSSTDNIAGELLTYVEFPNVGIYTMGVNSDDGFRVSPAEAAGRDGALHISEPANLAGLYLAIEGGANWCRPLWEIGTVSGELVLADPVQACQRLLNGDAVAGKIVMVDRGTCRFDNKGAYAELAGAIACIVVNNNPGMPIEMGGDPNEGARVILGVARRLNIPVVQIRPQDGNLIKTALTAGTRVVAS
ncbi:MAG: hypothetical protein Q7R41_15075, partial [Phycisphaerales bacterium]|nr:hypothetical protein [Phycisphaerales bacterium]